MLRGGGAVRRQSGRLSARVSAASRCTREPTPCPPTERPPDTPAAPDAGLLCTLPHGRRCAPVRGHVGHARNRCTTCRPHNERYRRNAHCASAETHTMRRGNPPQRSVPGTDRGRHLRDPIPHRRYAERPLAAIGLGNVAPQNRLRTIRTCAQCRAELSQETLDPVLLDGRERRPIDARRPAVPFHTPPRLLEHVSSPDPIHQGVKASVRGSLGRDPESALQLAHVIDGRRPTGVIGTGPAGHALARACAANVTTAGTAPIVASVDPPHLRRAWS